MPLRAAVGDVAAGAHHVSALHQTALDLRGPDAEIPDGWTDGLLFALGGPIYAGTNEVQRNIIAERLLGLPREGSKG